MSGLTKSFERRSWLTQLRGGPAEGRQRPALLDVSFDLSAGRTLGIVGESGSGKSTLARCITLLERPDAGSVQFGGSDLTKLKGADLRHLRRRIQLVFQDPYSSLNPRLTIGDTLGEVLTVHRLVPRGEVSRRISALLDLVGLPASATSRHPSAFSGGQRQRICIARALAAEPEVLVADEPVSALDVSIQAQILNLLRDLQKELGLAMLFISHNLFVVRYMTSDIAIMYGGRIVELVAGSSLIDTAQHPYTLNLVAAIPRIDAGGTVGAGPPNIASGALPVHGCPYRDRCPHAFAPCETVDPPLLSSSSSDHLVACHYVAGIPVPADQGVDANA